MPTLPNINSALLILLAKSHHLMTAPTRQDASRREALIDEQDALNAEYDSIISAVETCNAKIEQYNNNILRTNEYSEIINSNIERVEQ